MIKLVKIAALSILVSSSVVAQQTEVELRDSFYNAPNLRYGLGGHFHLMDFAGPQGASYLLNKHSISDKTLLLWEPGVSFSYWRKLNNKLDWTLSVSGNSINMPKISSDSAFKSTRLLGKNYNIQPIGDLDARIVFNINDKTKTKFSPYVAVGVYGSVYNKKVGLGVPVGLGLNYKIDQGIFLNIESNYRLAIVGSSQTHLMHKVGLIFWTNQKKFVTQRTIAVQQDMSSALPVIEPEVKPKKVKAQKEAPVLDVAVVAPPKPADTDDDGVPDTEDKCMNTKGVMKYFGCPVPDTDNDGINDDNDKCTREAGVAKYNGCPIPDNDGDGFNDEVDKCIDAPSSNNNGCPEIKKEILQKVQMAAKGINFETGSAIIKKTSFVNLDKVVAVLNSDAGLKVEFDGHTDNAGDAQKNLNLSQARADACKAYLVSKGIDAARVAAQGFGDTQPIADNATAAGKAKNRRTEIKIFN